MGDYLYPLGLPNQRRKCFSFQIIIAAAIVWIIPYTR